MTERLSPRMYEVLAACAEATGRARVAELVAQRVHRGEKATVARASVSRTLRRLWQAGLVELWAGWPGGGPSLTTKRRQALARLERVKADPAREYAEYLAWWRAGAGDRPAPRRSPEELIAANERRAQLPSLRVTHVELTPTGTEAVNSLDVSRVNRTPAEAVVNLDRQRLRVQP